MVGRGGHWVGRKEDCWFESGKDGVRKGRRRSGYEGYGTRGNVNGERRTEEGEDVHRGGSRGEESGTSLY